MNKTIPYVNLVKQAKQEKKEIFDSLNKLFRDGQFILGNETKKFENSISNYLKVKECVALNSGTDALTFGLSLIGVRKGDEVITPPNSFIGSSAAIVHLGAIPIFADVRVDQNIDPNEIEKKITKKTKAIMPVHLSGLPCDMEKIMKISKKYNLPVIEDAAQAVGTKYREKFVGTFGEIGCFSAHPLKNLNAMGDAGYLVTNNKKIAEKVRLLRNHGIKERDKVISFGFVSRMDNVQAAILNIRLKKLKGVINKRRANARLYFRELGKLKNIKLPYENKNYFHTYHTFVIQAENRNELKKHLGQKGISTKIHYPYLIFEQEAYKKRFTNINYKKFPVSRELNKKILTLPINQYMTVKEIKKICIEIKNFYKD